MKQVNDLVKPTGRELEVKPRAAVNEYYLDISNKFKTVKYALLIFLVVFLLSMISIFRSDITLENMKYLVRFFSSTSTVYSGDFDEIYYDTSGVVDVEMFNSDLVTIKSDAVNLYDLMGSNTMSESVNLVNPAVVTEGKYMLVYDLGGNSYKLFNNFSSLSEGSYDYPISCAAVSREGMYAVVTASLDYQSVIYLYDHNFNLISKMYKDKYVSDIEINDNGTSILVTCTNAQEGSYTSEVISFAPYSDKTDRVLELNSEMALMCGYHTDNSYTVLTDRALIFFNSSNEKTAEFPLNGIIPSKCLILDDYVVLAHSENIVGSQNTIKIFSPKGELIFEADSSEKILDIEYYEDLLYILNTECVIRIDLKKKEVITGIVEKSGTALFVPDANNIVISYSNMAKVYKSTDIFEQGA